MRLVDRTSLSAGNVQRVVPCEIYVRSRYFFIPNATSSRQIYSNCTSKRPLMIAWNKRIGAIGSSSLIPRGQNVLKSISVSVQTHAGVHGRWKRLKRLDAITKNVIYLKARRHERDFAFGEIKRTISKQNTRRANKTYIRDAAKWILHY